MANTGAKCPEGEVLAGHVHIFLSAPPTRPPHNMPRLVPRLARVLTNDTDKPKYLSFTKNRRRKKSLHDAKRIVQPPSFNFRNYDRSILLSEPKQNIVTKSRHYELHKSLPPSIHLPKGALKGKRTKDEPREMTAQERKWWSSPYCALFILDAFSAGSFER